MKSKAASVLIALGVAAFLISVVFTTEGRFKPVIVTVGAAEIPEVDIDDIRHMVTASSGAAGGNYDSADAPVGTSYAVPTGSSFWIFATELTPGSTTTVVQVGYGSTHVENSVAAPADSVTLTEFTLPANGELQRVTDALEIPAGMFPWARISGPTTWPSRVRLFGVER